MTDSFRFDAKNVFLTYPNSGGLTKERLRDFFVERLGARWYHIGHERHSDGRPHLHAYVGWDGRHRARGATHFDVDGQHPNVTIPRDRRAVVEYVGKGGDVLTNIDLRDFDGDNTGTARWAELLSLPTKRAFMEGVARVDPRAYILQHERVEYFCEKKYGRDGHEYTGRHRGDFIEPEELTRWVEEHYEVRAGGAPEPLPPR